MSSINFNQPNDVSISHVMKCMRTFIARSPSRNVASEFEFLYNLISPAFIRMRFEIVVLGAKDGSGRYVDADALPRSDNARGQVLPPPCFMFMNNTGTTVGRVLLTQNRERSNYKYPLSYEANGIVIDSKTWTVLAMPVPALNDRMSHNEIAAKMRSCVLTKIIDGTTVTLYSHTIDNETKWHMSSTNGYDVGEYKWIGPRTYNEVFWSVAALYPEFSLDKLDTNLSYSIVFRSPEFHQFPADRPKMFVVSAYNRTTLKPVYKINIGIPMQQALDIAAHTETTEDTPTSQQLKVLVSRCNDALTVYLKNLGLTPEQFTQPSKIPSEELLARASKVDPSAINYGYILRGTNFNIMIESTLLKKIRQFMYNLPKGERLRELTSRGVIIDNTTRTDYCALRAFLNRRDRQTFYNLFPQFAPKFAHYENIINQLSMRVLQCFKNKKTKSKLASSSATDAAYESVVLDKVAVCMYDYINNKEKINVYDSSAISIITDYIVDSRYVDLYLSLV